MMVTPTPTLPISIYPETLQKANETLNQAFGISFDALAIGFVLLIVVATAILFFIKRVRQS